ncbi:PucR family transcriptional regulator [Corynebacterium hylobatis]|uniref:PucR family transcriptional regulator n=1 Tax=Corynebacterium hylobatis TaxID=1859290 RepID=A0A430I165_9CORY|nr:helix-turn-helix domain-containing protein [Corynebacterium hylobatis]RSZ64684.1 PucR family transcriptional regulator [Corynebacterium hylobatis]
MPFVKPQLFESRDRLVEDVFEFSGAVDSLVEKRVPLEDFLGSVAATLGRRVEADVFGGRFAGSPDGQSVRIRREPGDAVPDVDEVDFRLDPPLPEWAERFVGQRLVHAAKLLVRSEVEVRVVDETGDRVRILLGTSGSAERRREMLHLLGLDGARMLTVVAIAGVGRNPEGAARLAEVLSGGGAAPMVRLGELLVLILRRRPELDTGVPAGLSVGLGESLPPERVRDSWEGARTAVRFSLPSPNHRARYRMIDAVVVDICKVGSLRILADAVDRRGVQDLADVQAIARLAEEGLPDTLNVLEAVAATESIRQAAQLVHMHHNTVAHRVEAAEGVLGFPLREIYGRTRLLIGLTLYRLDRNAEKFRPGVSDRRPRGSVLLAT